MELVNRTPFQAGHAVLQDARGGHVLVVIVKRTYAVGSGVRIAEEQIPIRFADSFHGAVGESSPALESDIVPYKRATDVVALGFAYAPRGRATEVDVTLTVGSLRRGLRVFGDRHWSRALGFASISSPAPFERMSLVYERAYGGVDASAANPEHHEREARNPVGRGFFAKRTALGIEGRPLPNIEDPAVLIARPEDRPEPSGFGFIARSWEPRVRFAGTYDAAWAANRAPLLPSDFDDRYFSAAHPRLVTPNHLQGHERVELVNAAPSGPFRGDLAGNPPRVRVAVGEADGDLETALDTLVLDPEMLRWVEVWRARKPLTDRELLRVRRIEVTA